MFKSMIKKLKKLSYYFAFSCISAILDFSVTTVLFNLLSVHYMVASTIGVIIGFIFHFILSIKAVFQVRLGARSFITYFLTFLIGLFLANTVLMTSYEVLHLSFNASKFLSMVLPFFVTYFLRSAAYRVVKRFEHDEQRV